MSLLDIFIDWLSGITLDAKLNEEPRWGQTAWKIVVQGLCFAALIFFGLGLVYGMGMLLN